MQISRLEIIGFKSFRTKTTVHFRTGITAIIGPNGSGKSNIVDSIRWVLGEQSQRALRISGQQDLFFGGSANHQPGNMAQVTLIFDNSNGEFHEGGAEVGVMRRLYRNGDGGYFINGRPTRLKDLRETFAGLGMSFSPNSIISQGKSDSLLAARPDKRRELFEEAAGIRGYRLKFAESRQRLERVTRQVRELKPVLEEVERSYRNTREQAEHTQRYRAIKAELTELKIEHAVHQYTYHNETLRKEYKDLQGLSEQREALLADSKQSTQERNEHNEQLTALRRQLDEYQQAIHALELEIERETGKMKSTAVHKQQLEERIDHSKQLRIDMSRQHEQLQGERKEIAGNIAALRKQIDERTKEIQASDTLARELAERISDYTNILRENKKDQSALVTRQAEQRKAKAALSEAIVESITAVVAQSMAPPSKETTATAAATTEQEKRTAKESVSQQSTGDFLRLQELYSVCREYITSLQKLLADQRRTENVDAKYIVKLLTELSSVTDKLAAAQESSGTYFADMRQRIVPLLNVLGDPQGPFSRSLVIEKDIETMGTQLERLRTDELAAQEAQQSVQHQRSAELHTAQVLKVGNEKDDAAIHHQQRRLDAIVEESAAIDRRLASDKMRHQQQTNDLSELSKALVAHRETIAAAEKRKTAARKQYTETQRDLQRGNKLLVGHDKRATEATRRMQKITRDIERATDRHSRATAAVDLTSSQFREAFGEDIHQHISALKRRRKSPAAAAAAPAGAKQDADAPARAVDPALAAGIAKKTAELEKIGPVNFMAAAEHAEIKRRYDLLSAQYNDFITAQNDLVEITVEIDRQSTERLEKCIHETGQHFAEMCKLFFNGGRGRIVPDTPDRILESGINVEIQPFGKKTVHIEQLSGGERTISALALLFSLYAYSPAHITIMDEVDATLDEQNIAKLCHYLTHQLSSAQSLLITHNRSTMSAAQTVVGITMEDAGVTKVVEVAIEDYQEPQDA